MYVSGILPPPARGRERPGKQSSGLLQRTACGSRTGRDPRSGRGPLESTVIKLLALLLLLHLLLHLLRLLKPLLPL